MPTYIKTGYWDKKAKAPDGWLDLNLFVETLIPPVPPPTPSTNIYNSDGTLTGNRIVDGVNSYRLIFQGLDDFFLGANNGITFTNSGTQLNFYPGQIVRINRSSGGPVALSIDFANSVYQFGQVQGGNATQLKIDDAAAFPVQVSGTNVSQTTSGTASGKFLKIKVDGVDYVIELKNPS